MVKLFFAVCIIGASFLIGFSGCVRRLLSLRRLRHISDGLLCMENDIRALFLPLPDAFRRAARYDALFEEAALNMEKEDAEHAFCDALLKKPLCADARDALRAFSAGLSAPDCEGQLHNLALCRTRLLSICEAAEKEQKKQDKLQKSMGLFAGIALVVLFF